MKAIIIFITLILFSSSSFATSATHGMVIFGKEKLYAYHLPMFHKIHNKQMVITFEVPQKIKDQITQLEDLNYLTFVPAPFDLDKFVEAPFELKGDIYSGHFEKDGELVIKDITFKNPKILYLQNLLPKSTDLKTENYQILGTLTDAYALHLIDGGEVIDQIFKLETISKTGDIETIKKYHYLSSWHLLELNTSYSINSHPGRCPSRLCGTPGFVLATFKTEALYFTDEVM